MCFQKSSKLNLFDDRLVFDHGKLPDIVRTDNIRHTHFSSPQNSQIPETYDNVKEFGEGVDRMCRKLSVTGTKGP